MVDRDATAAQARRRSTTRATTRRSARGSFRVRGETLEVFPAYAESAYRAVALRRRGRAAPALRPAHRRGDRARLEHVGDLPGHALLATDRPTIERAVVEIRDELERPLRRARGAGQAARGPPPAPAHAVRHGDAARARLLQRHRELLAHPGRPRRRASRPTPCSTSSRTTSWCFIDESHQTVPQIGGMYEGDRSRKQTLVDYGFRLPSALRQPAADLRRVHDDHARRSCSSRPRPASTSATTARAIVEQIVRPTGLVDPEVEVRETKNQIDDLMNEIRARADDGRARAGHHAHQEDGRGPHRLPDGDAASGCATCTRRSTRWSASRSSATCASASSTCWSASTSCARGSTCRRCRWWRSSTPTRRASCAARPR